MSEELKWCDSQKTEIVFVIDPLNGITKRDIEILFGDDPINYLPEGTTIWDILVLAGLFPSKSLAKKNWNGVKELEEGFADYQKLGKLNKRLTIFNRTRELHKKLEAITDEE